MNKKVFPIICNGCSKRKPTMTKKCECCHMLPCSECDDYEFCYDYS